MTEDNPFAEWLSDARFIDDGKWLDLHRGHGVKRIETSDPATGIAVISWHCLRCNQILITDEVTP